MTDHSSPAVQKYWCKDNKYFDKPVKLGEEAKGK